MRYAPEHNDATRERILEAASRLFRQHGIAAVGLAKIMAEAGLTVGTFYTHFKSKEALLREAQRGAPQARHAFEVAAAGVVVHVTALAARDDGGAARGVRVQVGVGVDDVVDIPLAGLGGVGRGVDGGGGHAALSEER